MKMFKQLICFMYMPYIKVLVILDTTIVDVLSVKLK